MKIGILGTGFGKTHLNIYNSMKNVEIGGIVGRNKEKLAEIKAEYNVNLYEDPETLFEDPSIDLIDVCYPTKIHSDYVIKALNNGKHVFCETPIAYSLDEAKEMQEVAIKKKKMLMVGLFNRFDQGYEYIHELIKSKKYGKVKSLKLNRRTAPIWGTTDKMMMDLMIHDFDYLSWFLGKPSNINTRCLRNDKNYIMDAQVTGIYDDSLITIEGSMSLPLSFPFTTNCSIIFEQGAIEYGWKWENNKPHSSFVEYPSEGKPLIKELEMRDEYDLELKYVIDCFEKQDFTNKISIAEAINSLEIALSAIDALE